MNARNNLAALVATRIRQSRRMLEAAKRNVRLAQGANKAAWRRHCLRIAKDLIRRARAMYANALRMMQDGTIPATHHYERVEGGGYHAVVAVDGNTLNWIIRGSFLYGKRQSAQRAALRMVARMSA